ncbi:hypothetical protein ABFB09_00715 [Dehalogenimonas sp. THU2]|uniref:hypothetical protein n=1 Tax=Dehalogenimonas sp. THU2 TaxID=3151121 RepID=UPI0032183C3D
MNKKRRVAQAKSLKRKTTLKNRARAARMLETGGHAVAKPARTRYEFDETIAAAPVKETKPKAAPKPKALAAETETAVAEKPKAAKTVKPKVPAEAAAPVEEKPKTARKTTKKAEAE